MISEKELKKEIKATKAFIKWLEKQHEDEDMFQVSNAYLDGLTYALKGKLD